MVMSGSVRALGGRMLAQEPSVTPPPGDVLGEPRDVQDLEQAFTDFINKIEARFWFVVAALVVLLVSVLVARLVRRGVERWVQRSSTEAHIHLVIAKLAYGAVVVLGVLIAVAVIGVNLGVLVGSLGLASLAVGFAMQDVLGNFIAGIALLLEHPFTKGDYVITQEAQGTVEDIRIRATHLRTPDGQLVLVPNKLLFGAVVTNASATNRRRLQVAVNIPYTEDPEQTRALLLEATQSVEGVVDDPAPQLLTQDFGQGAVQMLVWFWVNPTTVDMLRVRSQVLEVIERTLREADVDLAVPTFMATVPADEIDRRQVAENEAGERPQGPDHRPGGGQTDPDRQTGPVAAAKQGLSGDDGTQEGRSQSGGGRAAGAEPWSARGQGPGAGR